MTEQEFNQYLKNFTCTEKYYRHFLNVVFTDGIKWTCDTEKCYWFLDVIVSYQPKLVHEFQVWKLTCVGSSGVVTCGDGNGNDLVRQEVVTDFPYTSLEFWLSDNVVLLPGEY